MSNQLAEEGKFHIYEDPNNKELFNVWVETPDEDYLFASIAMRIESEFNRRVIAYGVLEFCEELDGLKKTSCETHCDVRMFKVNRNQYIFSKGDWTAAVSTNPGRDWELVVFNAAFNQPVYKRLFDHLLGSAAWQAFRIVRDQRLPD